MKKRYISKIKDSFLNSSIASKFKAIYIVLIAVCILSNAAVAHIFYTHELKKTITGLASQTIETISQNVESSLKAISKTSTYLLGTTDVQNYLLDGPSAHDAVLSKKLRNSLYLSMEAVPLVSSIIILNEDGTSDGAARYTMPQLDLERPEEADWYEEVHALKGAPLYQINGGGYFSPKDGKNYISIIRLINSIETAKPLGYMIINISVDSLLSFAREENESYSDICVYLQNRPLLNFLNPSLDAWLQKNHPESFPEESDILVDGERYLLLKVQDSTHEWFYLGATKYTAFSNRHKPFVIIFGLAMLISAGLFLLIAFCTSRFITAPLGRLMSAMKKTENGKFRPASVTEYKDEIGQLQGAYNDMVDKIQNLLEAKVSEQKLLRKAELNTLQEQIKPHFLYNSLSAIAYLITSQQNDRAYDLIISLSEYYRESLSKGSEIVAFSTEVSIVKNYLKLQKMRFPEIFEDEYHIQESTLHIKIPRLILQPLVENALYHGVIPTGEFGVIKVEAYLEDRNFMIRVSDDGVGMSEEKLEGILSSTLENNHKSFGLRGTVERLRIFYDTENIYRIVSRPGMGTVITISIPLEKTEAENGAE